ncbi:uncharacterized protein LOC9632564 isoform X2 [Selaginella moellendorffii]|uniref:uncharacterized protein LOC9632564 isoform X2 n=1 Tax=Selaginella moellendorffii TaxID=88036 RepID=UPI000D1CDD6D|nr:uncharacterized protein LOC9632564 isoform X2 [Selaginella moellendorffii]|eukprot:XP_024530665.1 uncharacterized protein LOC9632564 isoform X2 [Selaginella moellendorffii]
MSLGGAGAPAVISRSVCCCNADLSAPRHSMIAKLGQRFNAAGIGSAARVLLRDRSLMLPHVHVPDISWIDWRALKERGFAGVVFDKDNTLTAPYVATVWPTLGESLEECRKCFGENVALLSNSAGLYQFDPAGVEADALEKSLGISVIRHGSKKPAGNADALKKRFGCDASLLVMVGRRSPPYRRRVWQQEWTAHDFYRASHAQRRAFHRDQSPEVRRCDAAKMEVQRIEAAASLAAHYGV